MAKFLPLCLQIGALVILSASLTFGETAPKLDAGDKVLVIFSAKESGLDGLYTIDKDGTLPLPFVGPISVAGQSTEESGKTIEKAYLDQKIYSRLAVQIFLTQANLLILRDPNGAGYRYLTVSDKKGATGDYYTPEEKKELFRLDQLEARIRK